jgi:hypothetical protein
VKTPILVAVAVVAMLIVGALSLSYVFTFSPNVEITSFNTTKTSSGSSLGVVNVWFILNLTNIGRGDVENLTVTFSTNTTIESNKQLAYINSTSPYDHIADFKMGESCPLGDLRTGEAKEFMFYWAVRVGSYAPPLTATVKSNQAILDQETATIPPIPNVKITNFAYLGKWHGTTLGGAIDLFSLSYTNLGTIDVEGLTVTLNTTKTNEKEKDSPYPTPKPIPGYNTTVFLDEYLNGETYTLESLKAGETKTLEKTYFMFGAYNSVKPFALTALLKFNDTILDQAIIMIPISIAA